jgi:MFS family permease
MNATLPTTDSRTAAVPSCSRSESTFAIWTACIGIGLLFLARGAFQNYISPLFTHLGGFSYAQVAWLVTAYGLAQSVCAPLAGWYADRTTTRHALATSVVCGLVAFLVISCAPGFIVSCVAVFVAGLAFIVGKISFNTILVLHSSAESLRRSVAKRATLLNLGSFLGNSLAQYTMGIGFAFHAVVLGLLYVPLSIGLLARPSPSQSKANKTFELSNVKLLCKNRGFLVDALRRFALTLPYGCWGTIIPIYVIDQRGGSIEPIWTISLTSLLTTMFGAHFLAVYLAAKLYRRGFKWEWWSMTSVLLYCTGLMLLNFAQSESLLPVAIVVFICGEVLMTPCFDETAKKHSGEATMSTCMGLLHLVDGLGRWLGAAFALAVYGYMKNSAHASWFWFVVVGSFLFVSGTLHLGCHFLGKSNEASSGGLEPCTASIEENELMASSTVESE